MRNIRVLMMLLLALITCPGIVQGSADEVKIISRYDNDLISSGSGSIIADGFVLSSYHVIEGANSVQVFIEGVGYEARIYLFKEVSDQVLLEYDPDKKGVEPVKLYAEFRFHALVGQKVKIKGYPLNGELKELEGYIEAYNDSANFFSIVITTDTSTWPHVTATNERGDTISTPYLGFSGSPVILSESNLVFATMGCFFEEEGEIFAMGDPVLLKIE